jgi:hypothetical protein
MLMLLGLWLTTAVAGERTRIRATKIQPLTIVEVKAGDGQILSYRHLAGSTAIQMRGTHRAPEARIKLKVGSRPGFVELDINRNGISGLQPAYLHGKDFLTYVLWAVSVDGKASNLGEITFESGRPVAVNVTTTYQTFWLMVTAEPNYAVVDPSSVVVLYSARGAGDTGKGAIPISRRLFFFTHYSTYNSARPNSLPDIPNPLLQARKAVELTSRSDLLNARFSGAADSREEEYTRDALVQARTFLDLAEKTYKNNPRGQEVVQFARTAAQSAENARALATGAVGGLLEREMARHVEALEAEVERLKASDPLPGVPNAPASAAPTSVPVPASPLAAPLHPPRAAGIVELVRQPAIWFALSGWGVAVVLLFRRRTV